MESKKLYRSRKSKMICGVCGGIGEYFHMDATLIRLIWVVLIILRPGRFFFHSIFGWSIFGLSVILYLLAAVIIPESMEY